MRIITNHHARDLVSWEDLPTSAQRDFDYIDPEDTLSPRFANYRGSWYDVNEFTWTGPNSSWGTGIPDLADGGWDGYFTDTFFSAVVMRYVPDTDNEQVVMGLALS